MTRAHNVDPEGKAFEYALKLKGDATEMLNACNEYKMQFPILVIDLKEGSVSFPCENARTTLTVGYIKLTLNAPVKVQRDRETVEKIAQSFIDILAVIIVLLL